jgi:hypothetical protein
MSRASVPEQDCAAQEDEEQEQKEADEVEHQAVGADDAPEAEALNEQEGAGGDGDPGQPAPPEFPYPMATDDDLPPSWREPLDPLARRPGGRWVAGMYRRHRGSSAELTPTGATPAT